MDRGDSAVCMGVLECILLNKVIYLFLAVLGLLCFAQGFFSCSKQEIYSSLRFLGFLMR